MKKNKIGVAFATVLLGLSFASCEIGLGSAVDIRSPSVKISYPPAASVIRDSFVLAGTCDDDTGIDHVTVKILKTESNSKITIKTLDADVDTESNTWRIDLNEFDDANSRYYNGWEFCDGNYIAEVTAYDVAKKESVVASRSFDIDNTAPIFIVNSPSSADINKPSIYGTNFHIKGTVSDDHSVKSMLIDIYDAENGEPLLSQDIPLVKFTRENIEEKNVDIVVADYKKDINDPDLESAEQKQHYTQLYAGTADGVSKKLGCSIVLYDEAKVYKNPLETENNTKGNIVENFYLSGDIEEWKEIGSSSTIKNIVNKTISDNSITELDKQTVMNIFENSSSTTTYFSINSDGSPKYELNGFEAKMNADGTDYDYVNSTSDADLTITLNSGFDASNIKPDTLKVYRFGPYNNFDSTRLNKIYTVSSTEFANFFDAEKAEGRAEELLDNTSKKISSAESYYISFKSGETVEPNKIYYIAATAEDINGIVAIPASKFYAFKGLSSGKLAEINWGDTTDSEFQNSTVKNSGDVIGKISDEKYYFCGYINFPDGADSIKQDGIQYKIEVAKENKKDLLPISTPGVDLTSLPEANMRIVGTKVFFRIEANAVTADNKDYVYTIVLNATNTKDQTATSTFKYRVDTTLPKIKLNTISPVVVQGTGAEKVSKLNGKVTLAGNIEEKNLENVKYTVVDKDNNDLVIETKDLGAVYSFNFDIDTTEAKYKDKNIDVKVEAFDKAGNSFELTAANEKNNGAAYTIDQETDRPEINIPKYPADKDGNPTYKTTAAELKVEDYFDGATNNTLTANIKDDDGLSSVVVTITDKDGNAISGIRKENPQTIATNTTNHALSFEMPATDGIYKVTITATDNTYAGAASDTIRGYRQTVVGPIMLGVDKEYPELTVDKSNTNRNKTFILEGTASDANGIASIEIICKNDSVNKKLENVVYDAATKKYTREIKLGTADADLEDGDYTITVTATDGAGKSTVSEETQWTFDTKAPEITNYKIDEVQNASKTYNGKKWYNSSSIAVEAKVSDEVAGVKEVLCSTDKTNWVALNGENGTYTGSVVVATDGSGKKIYIKATDKSGNTNDTEDPIELNVDTTKPTAPVLASVAGKEFTTGETKGIRNGAGLEFEVTTSDATTGIQKVNLVSIGNKNFTDKKGTAVAGKENTYKISISSEEAADGKVVVKATDNAGNESNEVTLFTIAIDSKDPVVEISNIAPVVKAGTVNKLNGTVKITGKVVEDNLDTLSYQIKAGNDADFGTPVSLGNVKNFEISIDTTKYTGTVDVKVTAVDKSGNTGDCTLSTKLNNGTAYTIDQETDRPEINIPKYPADKDGNPTYKTTAAEVKVEDYFDGATNNTLTANIKDDDGLSSVVVTITDKDGNAISGIRKENPQTIATNTTNHALSFEMPATDGIYKVTITATDNTWAAAANNTIKGYRKTVVGPMLVGVDKAAPTLTVDTSNTNRNKTFTLKGTVSDANGIKEVLIECKKDGVTNKSYKLTNPPANFEQEIKLGSGGELEDGDYTIIVFATDGAGKVESKETQWTFDTNAPSISDFKIDETPQTYNSKQWYNSSSLVVEAKVSDAVAGVKEVLCSTDNTNWVALNGENGTYSGSVIIASDGSGKKVYIKATDKSENTNTSTTPIEFNVDTTKPTAPELVSVNGVSFVTGETKGIKGSVGIEFEVTTRDVTTGIKSVNLESIGSKTFTDKSATKVDGKQNTYKFTLSNTEVADGKVKITATDNAGNITNEVTLFTIVIDAIPPVVEISNIAPVVKGQDGAGNNINTLNGTVTVSGKVIEDNLDTLSYQIKAGNDADFGTPVSLGNVKNFEISIDTTKYTDTVDVKVKAVDKSGNTGDCTLSTKLNNGTAYTIDQETDKPVITPQNYIIRNSATALKNTDWFDGNSNNTLIGSVTDDDGLTSVVISITDKDGNPVKKADNSGNINAYTQPITANTTEAEYKYNLPAKDGIYKVQIVATDNTYAAATTETIKGYRKTDTGFFFVGVDTADPVVTDDNSNGTNYIQKRMDLSGTASDNNGISKIQIDLVNESNEPKTTWTWEKGAQTNEVTYDSSTGKWSISISDITKSVADGNYRVEVTVTDGAGKTKTARSKWVIDNTVEAPVIVAGNTTVKTIGSKDYFNTTEIPVTATTQADDLSGIKEVSYSTDNSHWYSLTVDTNDSTKWTGTANVTNGISTIYVKAVDKAGNTQAGTSITVKADTEGPASCELVSITGAAAGETTKLINDEGTVEFKVKPNDTYNEIESVQLKSIGGTSITASPVTTSTGGVFTISITNEQLHKGDSLLKGKVEFTAKDAVGNESSEFALVTIDSDNEEPTIIVNTITDADRTTPAVIDVNGDVIFSGTANDTNSLASVTVYYYMDSTVPSVPTNKGDSTEWTGTGWTKVEIPEANKYAWSYTVSTTASDNDKKLQFYVVAKDFADNVNFAASDELTVNQDSDRPKLRLSNLVLTEKDGEEKYNSTEQTETVGGNTVKYFWHSTDSLSGSVEDDDGTVKGVYARINDNAEWGENLYANGVWTINGLEAGNSTIVFKVVDANDNEFISTATNKAGPKIIDNNDQECLGYATATGKPAQENEILTVKVDLDKPVVNQLEGYYSNTQTDNPDDTKKGKLSDMGFVGGTSKNYVYIYAFATDANGIGNISVSLGDVTATSDNPKAKILSTSTGSVVVRYDLSQFTATTEDHMDKFVRVTATDNAGKPSSRTEKIIVDNAKPVVKFTTRQEASFYGNVDNTIMGSASDYGRVTNVYYAVKTSQSTPSSSDWQEVKYSVSEDDHISRENWAISFDGKPTTEYQYHDGKNLYKWYQYLTQAQMEALNDDVDMYVYIKAKDELGTESEPQSLHIKMIPNADRPAVQITYPDASETIGGEIYLQGSTSILSNEVEKVYIQIDPEYNGTSFDTNWATKLGNSTYNANNNYNIVDATGSKNNSEPALTDDYAKGIPVTGTTGWSAVLNSNGEFNEKINDENRKIAVRAFAVSTTNKVSAMTQVVYTIDPDRPRITNFELVQKDENGTVIAGPIPYTNGMNIKGIWHLQGTIVDASGLKDIIIDNKTVLSDGIEQSETGITLTSRSDTTLTNYKNWDFDYIIGDATADKCGEILLKIDVRDASTPQGSNSTELKLKYDNKAPVLNVNNFVTGDDYSRYLITNSNGTFTLSGSVTEQGSNQSGFDRVAVFFTRTENDKKYILDPMLTNEEASVTKLYHANYEELTSSDSPEDNMYWRGAKATILNNELTVTKIGDTDITTTIPNSVKVGGLCKVNGMIFRIKSITGNKVALDGRVNDSTTAIDVKFAKAVLVVDNLRTENGTTSVYKSDSGTAPSNDDGDWMVEGVSTEGSTSKWNASIDSTNILDGKVEVHFVAFDAAGNIAATTYKATVNNNGPRLAGVLYGTDANNMITTYATSYVHSTDSSKNGKYENGNIVTEITIPSSQRIAVKHVETEDTPDLIVIPRIVGGNLGLDWTLTYDSKETGDTKRKTTKKVQYTPYHSNKSELRNGDVKKDESGNDTIYRVNDDDYKLELSTLDFLTLDGDGIQSGEQTLTFTISDRTATDNLYATINLPVDIMIEDTTPPNAVWNTFYWNSKTDNSIYENDSDKGHIELENDLPEDTFTANGSGVWDRDPKVSGYIVMTGQVTDNVQVMSITITVDETEVSTVARKDDGTWPAVTNKYISGDMTIGTETTDPVTGVNTVPFTFTWNTATANGLLKEDANNVAAKADVVVQVTAKDKGSIKLNDAGTAVEYPSVGKESTNHSVQTGSTKDENDNPILTGLYKVDVVPYITKVYTELSSLNEAEVAKWSVSGRSALGKYPVRVTTKTKAGVTPSDDTGGETITVYGFNLTNANYTPADANDIALAAGTALTTDANGLSSTDAAMLAKYEVKSINSNILKYSADSYSGDFDITVNGVTSLNNQNSNTAEYNKQPNGYNNDNLTDNVEFDVWQINSQVAKPISGRLEQARMSIDPKSGWIGFAFADGPLYFTMGGEYTSGKTRRSYSQWLGSYDEFTSVDFVYDSAGHSYGVAAGGDIHGSGGDFFVLANSKKNKPTLGQSNTGSAENCAKLESIALFGDKTTEANSTVLTTKKDKIQSPSIATAVHGENTTVYLAYFDAQNNELRFRYGTVNANGDTNGGLTSRGNNTSYNQETNNLYYYNQAKNNVLILGSGTDNTTGSSDTANREAGQYVACTVVSSEGATSDDVVAVIWYNKVTKTLWYSYSISLDNIHGKSCIGNTDYFSKPVRVFPEGVNAGAYCKMTVDKNKGIHIAAYEPDSNDLYYAFLPGTSEGVADAQTAFTTALVDSNNAVGENITIDVALNNETDKVAIPYIGYYSKEESRPKLAYLAQTTVADGADINEKFTGAWECTVVPTDTKPDMKSRLFNTINVGVWKDADGVIKNSTSSINVNSRNYTASSIIENSSNGYSSTNTGVVLGNGTSYPVLGYSITNGASSNIETAQKR